MQLTEARTLFAYNQWANALMWDAAAALTAAQRETIIPSSFPSVHKTLAHIASAEWIWLQRWLGESPSAPPAWAIAGDFAAVRAELTAVETARDAYLDSLGDEDLAREVVYRTLAGAAGSNPLGELMRHVVNHSSYHRGQVATMLRQLGATPPSTDYVLYLRTRR
ncbi:MAG: DinB family protein [Gemmatimonadaceae bacterium]|nr:DinB family protein [Gemmatimonadaceae bacterium]